MMKFLVSILGVVMILICMLMLVSCMQMDQRIEKQVLRVELPDALAKLPAQQRTTFVFVLGTQIGTRPTELSALNPIADADVRAGVSGSPVGVGGSAPSGSYGGPVTNDVSERPTTVVEPTDEDDGSNQPVE